MQGGTAAGRGVTRHHLNEQQQLPSFNNLKLINLISTSTNCVPWHIYQFGILYHLVDRVIPNNQSWLNRKKCHVTGADRWKYFKRFDYPAHTQAFNTLEYSCAAQPDTVAV